MQNVIGFLRANTIFLSGRPCIWWSAKTWHTGGELWRSKLSRDKHLPLLPARCCLCARSMKGDTPVPLFYSNFSSHIGNASQNVWLIPLGFIDLWRPLNSCAAGNNLLAPFREDSNSQRSFWKQNAFPSWAEDENDTLRTCCTAP